MERLFPVLALALLFAPGTVAQAFEDEYAPLEYTIATETFNTPDPGPGTLVNFTATWVPEYGYDTRERALLIIIDHTLTIQLDSDGVWDMNVYIDGELQPGCTWSIQTIAPGGFLEGDLVVYPFHSVQCLVEDTANTTTTTGPVNHQVRVDRIIASGTPSPPSQGFMSIQVVARDSVTLSTPTNFEVLTGLSALEFALFPAIAFLGVILWSRAQDGAVRVFGATLAIIAGLLLLTFALFIGIGEAWVGTIALSIILMIVGIYLIIRFMLEFIDVRGAFR